MRLWTVLFIGGLVLSGLTAIPIRTQFEWAVSILGSDFGGGGWFPGFVSRWLTTAWRQFHGKRRERGAFARCL